MTHKIQLSVLRSVANERPQGYYESVVELGRIENDVLFIEEDAYDSLKQKYMEPLIQSFTQNLKPCSGCGKSDLSDSVYDDFWKPKEKNAVHSKQTDSNRSGDTRGSSGENQTN